MTTRLPIRKRERRFFRRNSATETPAYDEIMKEEIAEDETGEASPTGRISTRYGARTGRKLGIFAVVVAAALLVAFFLVHRMKVEDQAALSKITADRALAPAIVDIVHARAAPPRESLSLPGETYPWYKTTIYARVNGYVAKWLVDIGDRVHKGQQLAQIDTPELDAQLVAAEARLKASMADVKVAEADANFAKSQYERWWNSPKGVVSQQEREEKKAAYESDMAKLNASRARVNLDKATMDGLVAMTEFKNVTAPFEGVITNRSIDLGDLVTAGSTSNTSPLYSIAQVDRLRVFVDVPQGAAEAMSVGTPCDITVSDYPGRIFAGKVTRSTKAIDRKARTLRVEVDISNTDLALLPGMYIQATFHAKSRPLVQVPASAMVFRSSGPQVAVVDGKGEVEYRDVTIAHDNGSFVQLGSGIADGDRVVLNISNQIVNGEKVQINDIDRSTAEGRRARSASASDHGGHVAPDPAPKE